MSCVNTAVSRVRLLSHTKGGRESGPTGSFTGEFCVRIRVRQALWIDASAESLDALLFDLNEPFEPEVPQRLAQV